MGVWGEEIREERRIPLGELVGGVGEEEEVCRGEKKKGHHVCACVCASVRTYALFVVPPVLLGPVREEEKGKQGSTFYPSPLASKYSLLLLPPVSSC